MWTWIRRLIYLLILGGIGAGIYFAYPQAIAYWTTTRLPEFRFAPVTRGDLVVVVNATGTVEPVQRVVVGSFVSGPIEQLHVDFNDRVSKGDLLAKIDPRIYEASVARDEALLATAKAEVERVRALLHQAMADEQRALALREMNSGYISQTEIDQYRYNAMALQAQLKVAEASVDQAEANLRNSRANLGYAEIRSPVDGVVINRKIDPGQTLAASFQTPEMFIIAVDLDERVYIHASVDEADIGLLRRAEENRQPVYFTVDAYPDDLFEGTIREIRLNPSTLQNVVTYPVVVEAPNRQRKLLPGMTANLSFQIEEHEQVLRVPNAALRFYPKIEHVHPDDRKILEGREETWDEAKDDSAAMQSAKQRIAGRQERHRRHVWVLEGQWLRAVEVITGVSDYKYTEVVSGNVSEEQELVVGTKS